MLDNCIIISIKDLDEPRMVNVELAYAHVSTFFGCFTHDKLGVFNLTKFEIFHSSLISLFNHLIFNVSGLIIDPIYINKIMNLKSMKLPIVSWFSGDWR
jgi:hypothetical protein